MRNLLAFLAAVVLTIAGLGWYLGWYKVQVKPGTDGTTTVNIQVDRVKASGDLANGVEKGAAKLSELTHQLADKERKDKTTSPPAATPAPKEAEPKNDGGFAN